MNRRNCRSFAESLLLGALTWIVIAAAIVGVLLTLISIAECAQPAESVLACPPQGLTVDARVVEVRDGDTIVVATEIVYAVRLLDCWAPETRTTDLLEKRRGLIAKQKAADLMNERHVRVFIPAGRTLGDVITFDRVLGHVWRLDADGQPETPSINQQLVAGGYATRTKETP